MSKIFRTEKRKSILAPFDGRNADPHKNYGIGSETIWYGFIGKCGAVTWSVMTDKFLPHVEKELLEKDSRYIDKLYPLAGAVDYHHRAKLDYDAPHTETCTWLGKECWCDGSALAGEPVLKIWKAGGDDAVFAFLEMKYNDTNWPQENENDS